MRKNMKNLSELYIDEMVDSLINDHAAVLIGAGFSRNANPVNKLLNEKMPLWKDLTDLFCDKLNHLFYILQKMLFQTILMVYLFQQVLINIHHIAFH